MVPTASTLPARLPDRPLPAWTWLLPLLVCQLGTQVSLLFAVAPGASLWYMPLPLGLAMIQWWGPRVLAGVFLNALVSCPLWGLPDWWWWPLYALPETLGVGLGWLLFDRLARGRCWLPDAGELARFCLLGLALPIGTASGLLVPWLLAATGADPAAWEGATRALLADLLGGVVVTLPLLMLASRPLAVRGLSRAAGAAGFATPFLRPGRRGELAGVLLLILAGGLLPPSWWPLLGLPLAWAGLRLGAGPTGLAGALVTGLLLPHQAATYPVSLATLGLLCLLAQFAGRTVSALEEGERRWHEIFDAVSDAIFVHDAGDGRILEVNDRMLALYGLERGRLPGLGIADLSAVEAGYTQARAQDHLARAAAGEAQQFVWLARRGDGSTFWVEVGMRRALLGGQERVLAVVRDVDAAHRARQAEERLALSERRYAELLRATPDVLIVSSPADGRIREVNQAFERSLGWSREEVVGRSTLELGLWEDPGDRERLKALLAAGDGSGSLPVAVRRRDGQRCIFRVCGRLTSTGGETLLITLGQDITAERQAVADLAASERRLRAILDGLPIAAAALSAEGRCTFCNPALLRLAGRTATEVLGSHWAACFCPDDPRAGELLRQALPPAGTTAAGVATLVTRGGWRREVAWTATPLPGTEGQAHGLLLAGEDVTERLEAERRLRQSEERFQQAFQASPDAICIVEWPGARVVDVNAAFTAIFGWSRAEALGRTGAELGVWSSAGAAGFAAPLQGGSLANLPQRLRLRHGEERDFLLSASSFVQEGRGFLLVVSRDVTALRTAERAAREGEERLAASFLALPEAVVVTAAADGRIRDCNEAFIRLFGWSRAELLGRSTLELGLWPQPEDRAELLVALAAAGSVPGRTVAMRNRQGEVRDLLLSLRQTVLGGERTLLAVLRDVTETRATERALAESEAMLAESERLARLGHWIRRPDGRLRCSTGLLGLLGLDATPSPAQLLALLPRPARRRLVAAARLARRDRTPQEVELAALSTRGERLSLWTRIEARTGAPGEVPGLLGVVQDISDRKRSEARLLASEREAVVGRLAGKVAHEVNNPLGAIKAYLQPLRRRVADRPEVDQGLAVIDRQVERISGLVRQLLGFVRQRALQREPIPPAELLGTVAELYRPRCEKAGLNLRTELDGELAPARMDAGEIQQVLINLLENAFAVLPQGGTVVLAADQEGTWLRIQVRDDGPGLGEDPERLFAPFFSNRPGGTGLGLAIARRICEAHGGSLQAANRPTGGAEFTVRLPVG